MPAAAAMRFTETRVASPSHPDSRSRSAVLSVILFFVLGALVLTRVDVAAGEAQAAGPS